jgi:hypothetical protein
MVIFSAKIKFKFNENTPVSGFDAAVGDGFFTESFPGRFRPVEIKF